jgi:ornithine cyclodeaminase/alanine dehydrogenase-like protein (mu-crystallin family)
MTLRVLDEHDVRRLLPMAECIDLMADALGSLARGELYMPLRTLVRPPGEESMLALMPSHRGGDRRLWGLKTISLFPSNPSRGLDMHQGFVALFDGETGELRGVLSASAITAVRTAAVSGLATRLLARPDARTVAIIGAGVQGKAHVDAMRAAGDFERIVGFSRTPGRVAAELDGVEEVATAEDAVRGADVVVTATSSKEPVLRREWLKPGTHVNAVGSIAPARELDVETIRDSALFVDLRESALNESAEYLTAAEEGAVGPDHIRAEIGELVIGTGEGRRDAEELTVFKSLGLAVEDLVAAEYVLARAEAENFGTVASL